MDKYKDNEKSEYFCPFNNIEFEDKFVSPIEVFKLFFSESLFSLLSYQINL